MEATKTVSDAVGKVNHPPKLTQLPILWEAFFERMLPDSDERVDAILEFTSRMGVPEEYREDIHDLLLSSSNAVHAAYYLIAGAIEWQPTGQSSSLRRH